MLWWPPEASTKRRPQVNKSEKVPSDGHKISLVGGRSRGRPGLGGSHILCPDVHGDVDGGGVLWTDRPTQMKTLLSHKFVGGQ